MISFDRLRMRHLLKKLPVVDQLRDAAGDAERAALLLRLPDSVILACAEDLIDACAGFGAGGRYLRARVVALHAVRSEAGLLAPAFTLPLIGARTALRMIAAGRKPGEERDDAGQ